MTKKELAAKKEELCELRSQAIRDFTKFFKSKKEELKEKQKKKKEPESEDSEET